MLYVGGFGFKFWEGSGTCWRVRPTLQHNSGCRTAHPVNATVIKIAIKFTNLQLLHSNVRRVIGSAGEPCRELAAAADGQRSDVMVMMMVMMFMNTL